MKNNKQGATKKQLLQKEGLKSNLNLPVSKYSQRYKNYMVGEFPQVELMIKKIIRMPCCQNYYLKYPL